MPRLGAGSAVPVLPPPPPAEEALAAILAGTCGDPFAVLGPHGTGAERHVVVYEPFARSVHLHAGAAAPLPMTDLGRGFFIAPLLAGAAYRLEVGWDGASEMRDDPYRFAPLLSSHDLHLFREGRLLELAGTLGANRQVIDGIDGIVFAVWAPNAASASVVGDFNGWNATRHPMRRRIEAGVWEIFIPGVADGARYKFALTAGDGRMLPWKADPLAKRAEMPPATASIVWPAPGFAWSDDEWMRNRAAGQTAAAPVSVYEVHVSSWLRTAHEGFQSWAAAADRLIPHVAALGFTHVELLPVMEHPFGGSWGYQPLGLFAPTSRLGPPEDFAMFVDRCHQAGIGVILDWVPGHFPNDAHGLALFDGTALYEHADPREGFHRDWNTLIYNYGRHEVRGFLMASGLHWLDRFHIDGLRVDAVASMLYRDYSREPGEWVPNHEGGRENLEAVAFLREFNAAVDERHPGAITIAEESTAWPGVTRPVRDGGLGFHFKWNMGWMHDTLRFFGRDPIHRGWHLEDITFGLVYGFSETYMLPLSHDEVVHGKGSLLSRMPGNDWQRFAGLRALLGLMWSHPGKKLLFMGGEFGLEDQWDHDAPFPWPDAGDRFRQGLRQLVVDLNRLYRRYSQLHRRDPGPDGFAWTIRDDAANTVFAFRRSNGNTFEDLLVVFNATPVPRHDYRIGVPVSGGWREVLNTDSALYGGSDLGNGGHARTQDIPSHGEAQSLCLTLPPLGLIILVPEAAA